MLSQPEVTWIITASILFPVSTVFVLLRVLAIRIRGAGFKSRDYLVFVSYFCQIVYIIHFTIGVTLGGYGLHMVDLPLDRATVALKTYFSQEFVWATGTMAFRLSILLLYLEIFRFTNFRWAVIGTSVVVFLWWAACIITICALCQPTAFNWDRTLNGTCGDIGVVYMFTAAWNMALDIWVVFLPLPLIWKLQLSASKKASLTASFALGFCTAGINLGRLIQNYYCPAADVSYCAFVSCILVIAELGGGILVATVPTLGPLLPAKTASDSNRSRNVIRTIGSIPLRPFKKASTLAASLFSQADTKVQHEEVSVELTSRVADMGHQVEVGKAGASCDSINNHITQPY